MADERAIPTEREIPLWKKSKVIAGAMMLVRGYVEPVAVCDHCQKSLERADRTISVQFDHGAGLFSCPHCGKFTVRNVGPRPSGA